MLKQSSKRKERLLIVDDDALSLSIIVGMLHDDYACSYVNSGQKAIEFLKTDSTIDAIVMDYNMPNCNGIETMMRLQGCEALKKIPVIFVTAVDDVKVQQRCWKIGAADFIAKPVNSEEIKLRVRHQIDVKRREVYLENLACRDALTSLYNKQFLSQCVPKLVRQMNRDNKQMSVLMIDIDDFKQYNDTYGHLKGDKVIKLVAKAIYSEAKRPSDLVFRFGGEEFVVILPNSSVEDLKVVAQRVSNTVRRLSIKSAKSAYGRVTVSIGAAESSLDSPIKFTELLKRADKAMYKAKSAGKNMFVVSTPQKNSYFKSNLVDSMV